MRKQYNLRLLDFIGDYQVHTLPIVCTGSLAKLRKYAANNGYTWKPDNNVFGGYFSHTNGKCLFVTL